MAKLLVATISFCFLPSVAHRPLPPGIVCGNQFHSPSTALVNPNPKISWATYKILTCEAPIFWTNAEADAGQGLFFTVISPVVDRFESVRLWTLLIGPGMPELSAEDRAITPAAALADIQSGEGAKLFMSPIDQSSCAHLASTMMGDATEITDGRCRFHEPYSDSHYWTLLDQEYVTEAAGTFRFAVFSMVDGALTSAKISFACCDWPEDFITEFPMPEADCPTCGTKRSVAQYNSIFMEKDSTAQYNGYPPFETCGEGVGLPEQPSGDKCPAESTGNDKMDQPESCMLGCSNEECHSHNIFGECTYPLYWINPKPLINDANVTSIVLFKGDSVKFHSAGHIWPHNLAKMTDATHLASCDWTGAEQILTVEQTKVGTAIQFNEVGTFYYSCQMTGHCEDGQRLTIEVKDSSEGFRCHGHNNTDNAVEPLACGNGEIVARLVGNPDYGAGNDECAETCTTAAAMNWMLGAKEGPCSNEHFTKMIGEKSVQPPGSPMKVQVRIMGKDTDGHVTALACADGEITGRVLGNADYGAGENHCTEMCTTAAAMNWIPGAKAGPCSDEHFTKLVGEMKVQPAGSPMEMSVRVMGKDGAHMECADGEVMAYMIGNVDYGAKEGQCVQTCTTPAGMNWMTGAKQGSCADEGHSAMIEAKKVQPPGSPMEISVQIMGAPVDPRCHCHSYEEIKCDASGDALYDEHIVEMQNYCMGIVEGTEDTCPYKCFQPYEVMHLYYLECSLRPVHELFTKIKATNKCHMAAKAPYGSECVDADGVDHHDHADHDHADHADHGDHHPSPAPATHDHDHADHDHAHHEPTPEPEPEAEATTTAESLPDQLSKAGHFGVMISAAMATMLHIARAM